jgi:hypothetical protein
MPATLEKKPMAKKQAAVEMDVVATAIIEVPIAPALSSVEYATRSIELTLTPEQAQWVKRLWKALDERGAKLLDGRYVTRPGNALQWVIEQGMASDTI